MPLDKVVALVPVNRQVYEPLTPKQLRNLAPLVALEPAVKTAELKSAVEYENFHCSPAGFVVADVSERFIVTLPPADPVAEESASETCAEAIETQAKSRVESSTNLASRVFGVFISLEALS